VWEWIRARREPKYFKKYIAGLLGPNGRREVGAVHGADKAPCAFGKLPQGFTEAGVFDNVQYTAAGLQSTREMPDEYLNTKAEVTAEQAMQRTGDLSALALSTSTAVPGDKFTITVISPLIKNNKGTTVSAVAVDSMSRPGRNQHAESVSERLERYDEICNRPVKEGGGVEAADIGFDEDLTGSLVRSLLGGFRKSRNYGLSSAVIDEVNRHMEKRGLPPLTPTQEMTSNGLLYNILRGGGRRATTIMYGCVVSVTRTRGGETIAVTRGNLGRFTTPRNRKAFIAADRKRRSRYRQERETTRKGGGGEGRENSRRRGEEGEKESGEREERGGEETGFPRGVWLFIYCFILIGFMYHIWSISPMRSLR
jgi:hypothetical protein